MTEPSEPGELTQAGAPSANLTILARTLEQSCVELLRDYGLVARIQGETLFSDPPTSTYAGSVDFSGKEIKGRVLFCASRQVIEETARGAAGMQGEFSAFSDWTCELANQLIGRVKNKLRSYDVQIDVNAPRLLPRSSVNHAEPGVRFSFRCDAGTFSGFLDVLIAPGVVLRERLSDEPLVQEGDLIFL